MIARVFLALLLMSSVAAAQTVSVRSGEHDGFSRLVLTLPEGASWTLGRLGDDYGLAIDPVPDGFDMSDVFNRIPRDRLGDLRFEEGRLVLDIACDCRATAFGWQGTGVVIDISDGTPSPLSEFEAPLDAPASAVANRRPAPVAPERTVLQPVQIDMAAARVVGVSVSEPRPEPEPVQSDEPAPIDEQVVIEMPDRPAEEPPLRPFSSPILDTSGPALPVPSELDDALEAAPRVAALEAALIEGLGRAASQGLLSPSADFEPEETAEAVDSGESAPPTSQAPMRPGMPGIAARTSIERDRPLRPEAPETASGEVCLDEALFNVSAWADDRPFFEQLAERRSAITTDTGAFVEEETLRLAQLYVHFGFGVEALDALEQTTRSSPDSDVLAAMARIVDDIPHRNPLLAGQEDCPSDVALWSVLAAGDEMDGAMGHVESVIQTLRRLPDGLRGHLGQRLAEIFAGLGDVETAETLLSVARGAMTANTTDERVVEAAIADHSGDTAAAIDGLKELAEADARMTPEALVELVTLSIREGEPVPEDVISLVQVMRFENARNPDVVAQLIDAEIRARLNNGANQAAMDLVAETAALAEEDRLAFNSQAVAAIARDAAADDFLAFAYGEVPAVDAETENMLARRLVDLGFAERAASYLRSEARQEAAAERRYLEAEIALGRDRFEEVEDILAGMTDDRALGMRIEALTALARHDEALALAGLGSGDADDLLAWRAQAWPLLSAGSSAEGPMGDIATLRQEADAPEAAAQDADPGPLAQRRALLAESASSREAILDLLGQFPVSREPADPATN